MQPLKAIIEDFPAAHVKKVRDIVYYEGPLVAEMVHPNGDSYICCWCDCDEFCNRWLTFRIDKANVPGAENFLIEDLLALCLDTFVYFMDIDTHGDRRNVAKVFIADIPEEYASSRKKVVSPESVTLQKPPLGPNDCPNGCGPIETENAICAICYLDTR